MDNIVPVYRRMPITDKEVDLSAVVQRQELAKILKDAHLFKVLHRDPGSTAALEDLKADGDPPASSSAGLHNKENRCINLRLRVKTPQDDTQECPSRS